MSNGKLLERLSGAIAEAKRREKEERRKRDFVTFARAYRKTRRDGGWIDSGCISYKKTDWISSPVSWRDASRLAELKLREKINIQARPQDKGVIAASICNSLEKAFNPNLSPTYKNALIREAIAGMYLLDLTDNKTLLRMIERGLNDPENYPVAEVVGDLFSKFGMIGEYYNDLDPRNPEVILSVIEDKLRPKELSDEEALKNAFGEVCITYADTGEWPHGLHAARIRYTTNSGEERSARLDHGSVLKIAGKILEGEITEWDLPPRDLGKLYASVMISCNYLLNPKTARNPWDTWRLERVIAGLYLLSELDKQPEMEEMIHELLSKLLEERPDLAECVKETLSIYFA